MILLFPLITIAQEDSIRTKSLSFTGDFRFRIEPDWDSRKPDGSYREDRTRLRYRLRFGFKYQYNQWVSFGARIRTGDPRKQQDPQLTLGDGFKEFNTLPIGFEKVFIDFKFHQFNIWLGKNTFPFEKQNELFWSDNVYPEGVFLSKKFNLTSRLIESVKVAAGHFIVATNGTSFSDDGYFQGLQVITNHWKDRLKLFPSFYYFNQMPNIPDGFETYNIDYSIFQMGVKFQVVEQPKITLGLDYYFNLENLSQVDSIPANFQDEKTGLVMAISYGALEAKGDWLFRATYTYLEQYSAVDFLAQNDWARWDYSSSGSPDGRLTNYQGLELMAGYAFSKKLRVNSRFFKVDQLVPYGTFKENGYRIRFDVDIGF
jgi:hypothetical protein